MSVILYKKSAITFLLLPGFVTTLLAASPELSYSLSIEQIEKITAPDKAENDYFGFSVAANDDTVLISAYGNDDNGSDSGLVYIYDRNIITDQFEQTGKLIAHDAAEGDNFGYSVAISGATVVVGAPYDDDGGDNSGSAYIYERNTTTGLFEERAKLTASDAAQYDFFGTSVAISGEIVVVGADGNDDNGSYSGSAYIFESNTTTGQFVQLAKLTASDAAGSDFFGRSVAISGKSVVIGSFGNDDNGSSSGSAYIFEGNITTGQFVQLAKLTASDAKAGARFGWSVAIDDDTVVIGAYEDDDTATESGSAYIYERNMTSGLYEQRAKLTAYDAEEYDDFGWSVAVNGDTVAIGAPYDNCENGHDDCGSAYIFKKPTTGWKNMYESIKLIASDQAGGDFFGWSVAINGKSVLSGAYMDSNDGIDFTGSVYLYKESTPPAFNPSVLMYLLN